METWVQSKKIYEGKIISLRVGDVRIDDDATSLREVVEHPGGVAVVPVLDDSVILVKQFRIATGQHLLELPAGKLEGDEDPEQRGIQELQEETGYKPNKMIPVASFYASPGYTSEMIHVFLAFDLEHVGQNPEEDERIELVRLPIKEISQTIAENRIPDGKTIIGLQALLTYLDS